MSAAGRPGAGSKGADARAHPGAIAGDSGRGLRIPSRWWICGGIGLVAVIALGTAAAILTAHGNAVSLAQRELQNMAFVLAARANSEFEAIERVQINLIERVEENLASAEDFERKFSGNDVHRMLHEKHLGLPYVGAFSFIDAQGKVFNFSRLWPAPAIDVSDRRFFEELKSNPTLDFTVSEPLRNRATGTWVIHLVRKVHALDGQFAGLVAATIEIERFQASFQSIVLGASSSVALFRRDAMLLARYPRLDSVIGQTFKAVLDKLEGRQNGAVRIVGTMEGRDRLLAVQHLARYPFYMVVGLDTEPALAGWRREAAILAIFGFLSAGLVGVVTFLIVRQLSHQDRRSKHRIRQEKQRLDTAVTNMTQGLLLFDASERIVVCNRRYLEMYGLDPDVVRPGCSLTDLLAHRRQMGSFTGDVANYRESILQDLAQNRATEMTIETPDGRSIQIVNKPLAEGGWVATHEDITERKRAEERIAHLAHYDPLTNLPNRALFREHLEQQLNWVHRGSKLAVLYLDLDHFKSINDTLGHPLGDELLTAVATRLRACVRDTDIVARLGGDEFAVIQTAIEQPADVTGLATRILENIREPFDLGGGHHVVTDTSIGIATAPDDGTEPDRLLKNADLALYGAKANGRGTYHFFEPGMDAQAKARRAMEFDLREAIMCGGFELHYQPLVDLRTGAIIGCEALLRWQHPVRGLIPPGDFIPLAEETGLINQLGEWVLLTACTEATRWPDHTKLAINISPVQFRSPGLALKVIGALAESGLSPRRLELEITEAVLIRDDEAALRTLHQLRDAGVRIAMDDFGTGFSSLSYLQRFPFDKIKIDRCFIKDVTAKDGSVAIVRAVIGIAKARKITTTAEGVETDAQRRLLSKLGCDEMQGFLISRAIPAAEIRTLWSGADGGVRAAAGG
ncbi:MAG: EAL domain-containing protein [Alphaproteobacteria bacterium]|nr:MAG: EAL domain-containing protein [Alphaproteobacteria bacterium]